MNFQNIFKLNILFIFVITLITIIGFFALYSAADGSYYPWAIRHAIRFCVLFFLMIFIALMDLKKIFKYAYLFFFLIFLLFFSVELFGTLGKGAERWIWLFGVSIRPSELVKITIILSL